MFAIVDMEKCKPELCDGGRCQARTECPTKAILQIDLGESPLMDAGRCTGCRKCLPACPVRAILMV